MVNSAGGRAAQRHAAKAKRPYIAAWPSRKSIRRMTETVRIQTGRNMEWMDAGEMVKCLNQKLGGRANTSNLVPSRKLIDSWTDTPRCGCAGGYARSTSSGAGDRSATPTSSSINRWDSSACPNFRRAFHGRRHDVQSESRMREMRLSGSMRGR